MASGRGILTLNNNDKSLEHKIDSKFAQTFGILALSRSALAFENCVHPTLFFGALTYELCKM